MSQNEIFDCALLRYVIGFDKSKFSLLVGSKWMNDYSRRKIKWDFFSLKYNKFELLFPCLHLN